MLLNSLLSVVLVITSVTAAPQTHQNSLAPTRKPCRHRHSARTPLKAVIGVLSAPGEPGEGKSQYTYANRRKLLRETWFPSTSFELAREEEDGVLLRFVVGQTVNAASEAILQQENKEHGDLWRLHLQETSRLQLHQKVVLFLREATCEYMPEFIIKIDDDKYVRLDRLKMALPQWQRSGAEYIGCFQVRGFFHDPLGYFYDPNHNLLSRDMNIDPALYAVGTMYALSGDIAEGLATLPLALRDFGSGEDIAMGGILRAFNASMYDDRRLCAQSCTLSMIAMDIVTNDDMYRVDEDLCSNQDVTDLTCFTHIHTNVSCQLKSMGEPRLIPSKWDLSVDHDYLRGQ